MIKILLFSLIAFVSCRNLGMVREFNFTFFYNELIFYHNLLREIHSVDNITKDKDLENLAQISVDKCKTAGKLVNSDILYNGQKVGQHLFVSGGQPQRAGTIVHNWYKEFLNYDFNKGQPKINDLEVGHFTQIVWKATTKIGCAFAEGNWNDIYPSYYFSCIYFPKGNIPGEYAENVFKYKKITREK